MLNPIANFIYACRGGADTVLCDGKILMENGRVLTIDEPARRTHRHRDRSLEESPAAVAGRLLNDAMAH